ncbi:MAG: aminoacyl-tRNA hydrolase [Bacteroidetes bacterium CG12_big_fil_rev_8_21_14_0_65_60_17]|nr:MAG: aminoacyl-tRNA hydrolase [Bacteroidetes bacterium CG12_big_fil_rev_8_21_14_0_65_60_17]
MSTKRFIIGLGNPGPEYARTRHNIGFDVVDAVAARLRDVSFSRKGQSDVAEARWRGRHVGLAKPQTFMNRSGLAVEEIVRRHGLDKQDLLVVVDDIHLPFGRIRIRPSGGSGGHNGLEDIGDWLDGDDFPRLRFGIGAEFDQGRQSEYVLAPFDKEQQQELERLVAHARDAALAFVSDGLQTAMNRYNL